jgi:hypothetical protein
VNELIKEIWRRCPATAAAFLGRKFSLPRYREGDYYSQDTINEIALMMLMLPALRAYDESAAKQLLGLRALGETPGSVRPMRYNDPRKALAWLIKRNTMAGDEWIKRELDMGHRSNVSRAPSIGSAGISFQGATSQFLVNEAEDGYLRRVCD